MAVVQYVEKSAGIVGRRARLSAVHCDQSKAIQGGVNQAIRDIKSKNGMLTTPPEFHFDLGHVSKAHDKKFQRLKEIQGANRIHLKWLWNRCVADARLELRERVARAAEESKTIPDFDEPPRSVCLVSFYFFFNFLHI
eukprot:GABV01008841.1.p3 GENE.GABV01008841.1~~GABV01008841.1.p3  ORF type:complete len:138 (-),score=34.39 GABV01008841.1:416-829(-)